MCHLEACNQNEIKMRSWKDRPCIMPQILAGTWRNFLAQTCSNPAVQAQRDTLHQIFAEDYSSCIETPCIYWHHPSTSLHNKLSTQAQDWWKVALPTHFSTGCSSTGCMPIDTMGFVYIRDNDAPHSTSPLLTSIWVGICL